MRFNAVEYLESLFAEATVAPAPPRSLTPDDLPADWHLLWDERAALVEFDGCFHRERAEALALSDILEQMRRAGGKTA